MVLPYDIFGLSTYPPPLINVVKECSLIVKAESGAQDKSGAQKHANVRAIYSGLLILISVLFKYIT